MCCYEMSCTFDDALSDVDRIAAAAREWTLQMIAQSLGDAALDVIRDGQRVGQLQLEHAHGARVVSMLRQLGELKMVDSKLALERADALKNARAQALASMISVDARVRAFENYYVTTVRAIADANQRSTELVDELSRWKLDADEIVAEP